MRALTILLRSWLVKKLRIIFLRCRRQDWTSLPCLVEHQNKVQSQIKLQGSLQPVSHWVTDCKDCLECQVWIWDVFKDKGTDKRINPIYVHAFYSGGNLHKHWKKMQTLLRKPFLGIKPRTLWLWDDSANRWACVQYISHLHFNSVSGQCLSSYRELQPAGNSSWHFKPWKKQKLKWQEKAPQSDFPIQIPILNDFKHLPLSLKMLWLMLVTHLTAPLKKKKK